MLSWLWYVILKGATQLLQVHALAVAFHVAESPGSNGKGLLEVVALLEFLDESIENLARLGRGQADEGRDEVALGNGEIHAVKHRHTGRLKEVTVRILSRIHTDGYDFVEMKDVLNGEGLVFLLGSNVVVRIRLCAIRLCAKRDVTRRRLRLSERTKVRRLHNRRRDTLEVRRLSKVE